MSGDQTTITDWRAGTTTEDLTKTVILKLESSQRKREKLQTGIDEFGEMCRYFATILPSYPPHEWHLTNTEMYRHLAEKFDDDARVVSSKVVLAAQRKVVSSFLSHRERPGGGGYPTFEETDYLRLSSQEVTLAENERGFGLKLNFIPYNAEWFHIDTGTHQRELLTRVVTEEDTATLGAVEVSIEDETVIARVPIQYEVEVYKPGEVPTAVGVDLGETVLWAVAIVGADEVERVELESGREFRHYRERLDAKRARLSERGDLVGVRATKDERRRYTKQVTHTATRRIVDLAADHAPCVIRIEDLTDYRETATDPIHDWPYAMLQEQLAYKARDAGIPVEAVDPANTSITCRKCGETNPQMRDGTEFECWECGYEVHADVNAAINIANEN